MIKRFIKVVIGTTISALGTAMVMNCGLGSFAMSATSKAIGNWLGISFALTNIMIESIMISYATYKGEGLGWTAIINATYGSLMIAVFHTILPHSPWLCVGGLIIPISWSIMEKAQLGATGSNVLMRALMKTTGKNLRTVRMIEEGLFIIIGFIGARHYINWFTIFLTFVTPFLLDYIYKLTSHKPAVIEQEYINFSKLKNIF